MDKDYEAVANERLAYPGCYGMTMWSKDRKTWVQHACHGGLLTAQMLGSDGIVQYQYQDYASGAVKQKQSNIVKEYIGAVYELFGEWIDSSYEESLLYPGKVYARMNTAKINSGNLLGILNCFRGVEEQAFIAYNYHVVRSEYPKLTTAQAFVIAWITHPPRYVSRYYNSNHSIWLPHCVKDLKHLKDFSFIHHNRKKYEDHFTRLSKPHDYGFQQAGKTSWALMLPEECYHHDTFSSFGVIFNQRIDYPLIELNDGAVEYYLDSNSTTVKGVKLHEKINSSW